MKYLMCHLGIFVSFFKKIVKYNIYKRRDIVQNVSWFIALMKFPLDLLKVVYDSPKMEYENY